MRKKLRKLYYSIINKIPMLRKREEKKLLIQIGAIFMNEVISNQPFRRAVVRQAPMMKLRLSKVGLKIKE